jgi:hypothetical protein
VDHEPSAFDITDLDRLLAVDAISRLKGRYFYYLDTKQWEALRRVFWDDAVFDPEGDGAYTFDGVDGFIAGASSGLADAVSVHHGHTPIIEAEGDQATGIWAMSDYVDIGGERPRRFVGYGHYHERYERRRGEWRMSSWKLTRLRVDRFPVAPVA